jgi:UDP-glucose 4-epimerase
VVFASSSSVYNGLEPPHKEDMDIMVTDYYTEARLAMERLGKLYNILHGVPVIAMRFFSVYGPHEKAKGRFANTVSQFMWSMQDGQRPVIYGDGSQTRDYIFVKDVVAALKMAMKSDIGFDVLNVGTGTNTTTNDTIRLLNRVLGKSIEPEYVENPIKNYVHHTKSDCTKARERLGFTAKTTLEEGIRSVLS